MILMGLSLTGRRVVIAGGGAVATRRALAFVAERAEVRVVAPSLSEAIEGLAAQGSITVERRTVRAADVDGAWLVVAATDNPTVNEQVAAWAEVAKAWCINASDAVAGSARMAAQSRHDDLLVGVASLANPDPGRVRDVRDALAHHIDGGGVSLRARRAGTGRVVLVGAGPGAGDLITLRGSRALAAADVVIHDRLGTAELLARVPDGAELIDVGKRPDDHPVPQRDINRLLIEHAQAGRTVVRLKGGDPFVFGRGGEEVEACIAAGISVEVIPGITSAIAGPSAAGIPVTDRSVTSSVHIMSGHAGLDEAALASLRGGVTVVLLMAVGALEAIVEAAVAEVPQHTPVAIVEDATLATQRVTRATLGTVVKVALDAGVASPAVIVIGDVARAGFLAHRDAGAGS